MVEKRTSTKKAKVTSSACAGTILADTMDKQNKKIRICISGNIKTPLLNYKGG